MQNVPQHPFNHMEIILRPATQSDDATIKSLVRSEQLNPFGLKWQQFVVAESAGEIVGCAQVKQHRGGVREFASLMVLPSWRKRGVAGQLINHFLRNSPPPLWLMCGSRLVPFYEQYGFQNCQDAAVMPGRFRRIYKISRFFARGDDYVAIMRHSA